MYRDVYTSITSEKFKQDKNKFRITKKSLNDVNDYILNFQRYYELIKNYPEIRKIKNSNSLDINVINIEKPNKKMPYNKLQNDISNIYKRICTDNNNEKNAKINYKYNILLNPNNYHLINYQIDKTNNSTEKPRIKLKEFNSPEKYFNNPILNDAKINTYKKNIIKRDKIDFGNYAQNNTFFNHPQLYLLKYNRNYSMKGNSLQTNSHNGLKITRTGNFENLIPLNPRKAKVRNNFYNYYIGLKHSKHVFNI